MKHENKISEHTIKKFELVAKYVESWVQKLLNFKSSNSGRNCKEIVFIDCMCNNGIYENAGNAVEGTPIRVAKIISAAMKVYPNKKAYLYFNDKDAAKIAELKRHLPPETNNFRYSLTYKDGNVLLEELQKKVLRQKDLHYLLFYDPYKAEINWDSILPYFFGWGEVILNHMDLDTRRAIKSVKRQPAIDKYEQTYLTSIEDLVTRHDNKNAYDEIVKNIIKNFRKISNRKYYLASFPFFIKTNSKIYSIIFFTNSEVGFKLFKKTAWKTFGDKSSNQNTHGRENQQTLFKTLQSDDKQCYYVSDIVDYIIESFKGKKNVPLKEIWEFVDEHPIFPTEGYIKKIKKNLQETGLCEIKNELADFV